MAERENFFIKACDKGAGIIILNFNDYVKTCYEHLTSEQTTGKAYYTLVNEAAIEKARIKRNDVIKEPLENKMITQSEFDAMNTNRKDPARFYCDFKVHKEHKHMKPPPRIPIISSSESLTEKNGTFVEHYFKNIANTHKTYLQDTPDF